MMPKRRRKKRTGDQRYRVVYVRMMRVGYCLLLGTLEKCVMMGRIHV